MASQSASKRQTCEKDFSPPDNVLAPRPSLLSLVMSGSTYKVSISCGMGLIYENTCKSRTLFSWSARSFPRKLLSLRRYVNCAFAREEMCDLKLCQRFIRCLRVDLRTCVFCLLVTPPMQMRLKSGVTSTRRRNSSTCFNACW